MEQQFDSSEKESRQTCAPLYFAYTVKSLTIVVVIIIIVSDVC